MKKSKAVPKVDPYLEGLMAKLLDRLTALEKKMDLVIERASGRPSSETPQPRQPQQSSAPAVHLDARPRRERQLYEAICADCSKVCEVPFRPSENRPVYCKECFAKRKSGGKPQGHGMPVIMPVSIPPKPVSKLGAPPSPAPAAPAAPKKPAKAKKAVPAKKAKKKK